MNRVRLKTTAHKSGALNFYFTAFGELSKFVHFLQLYKESTSVHALNVCNPSAGLFILNHELAHSFNSSLKQELVK